MAERKEGTGLGGWEKDGRRREDGRRWDGYGMERRGEWVKMKSREQRG